MESMASHKLAHGGLAEILTQLNGNFEVLKGQLGINNPQSETEKISLRSELFRIGPPLADGGATASDDRWKDALKARIVPDLNAMPEFVRYCRPFASRMCNPASSSVSAPISSLGKTSSDSHWPPAITTTAPPTSPPRSAASASGWTTTMPPGSRPRRAPTWSRSATTTCGPPHQPRPSVRVWSVVEQRIPTPFVINQAICHRPVTSRRSTAWTVASAELRRHGDFRMYHDNGDPAADDSELILDSRLIGRSVWNSEWMLIIPGAGLHADPTDRAD